MSGLYDKVDIIRIAPKGYPLPIPLDAIKAWPIEPRVERVLRRRERFFPCWDVAMRAVVLSQIESGCRRRGWRLIHARSGRVGAYLAVQLTANFDRPLSLAESIKRHISLRAWSEALIPKRVRACSTAIGWDSAPSDDDFNVVTFRIDHAVACGAI